LPNIVAPPMSPPSPLSPPSLPPLPSPQPSVGVGVATTTTSDAVLRCRCSDASCCCCLIAARAAARAALSHACLACLTRLFLSVERSAPLLLLVPARTSTRGRRRTAQRRSTRVCRRVRKTWIARHVSSHHCSVSGCVGRRALRCACRMAYAPNLSRTCWSRGL